MRLYRWNALVAAYAMIELGYVEVAMRNAYHVQLVARYSDWWQPTSALWTTRVGDARWRADQQLQNNQTLDRLRDAAVGVGGGSASVGRIIANTSMGPWVNLTDAHREPTLWTPMLKNAYPEGSRRGAIHRMGQDMNTFRNRVAHHELLFVSAHYLADRMRQVRLLHAMLDPFSADAMWTDRLEKLVDKCPVRGLVEWPEALRQPPTGLLARVSRGAVEGRAGR